MRTTDKKYLPLYNEWLEAGKMLPSAFKETAGLCDYFDSFLKDEFFKLMIPSEEDFEQLEVENKSTYVWASDLPNHSTGEFFTFNTLRQNIVLFMAAMNNEL